MAADFRSPTAASFLGDANARRPNASSGARFPAVGDVPIRRAAAAAVERWPLQLPSLPTWSEKASIKPSGIFLDCNHNRTCDRY